MNRSEGGTTTSILAEVVSTGTPNCREAMPCESKVMNPLALSICFRSRNLLRDHNKIYFPRANSILQVLVIAQQYMIHLRSLVCST